LQYATFEGYSLHSLARERRIDLSRWTLARANAGDVRKIAALLNIQYNVGRVWPAACC
jgi:hypothetical protein